MIFNNFYDDVLINPVREGADCLKIISGYATSAMAFHHLEDLSKKDLSLKIILLVGMCSVEFQKGMCSVDGISVSNHKGFQNIVSSKYSENFSCSYLFKNPPVHSKLLFGQKKARFIKRLLGLHKNAFSNKQREVVAELYDSNVLDYITA